MDPEAALLKWVRAVSRGDRYEANNAYSDLRTWIERGGFEPRWGEKTRFGDPLPTRAQFFSYSPRTGKFKNPRRSKPPAKKKRRKNYSPREHIERGTHFYNVGRHSDSLTKRAYNLGQVDAHADSVKSSREATRAQKEQAEATRRTARHDTFEFVTRNPAKRTMKKKRRNLHPETHTKRALRAARGAIHESHPVGIAAHVGGAAAHAYSVLDDRRSTRAQRKAARKVISIAADQATRAREPRRLYVASQNPMKKKRKPSAFNLRVRAYMKKHPRATLAKAAKACAKRKNGEQRPKDRAKFKVKIHAHKRRKARRNWEPVSVTAVMPRLTGKLRPRGTHAPRSPKLGKHAFTPTVARANPGAYTLRYYSRAGKLIGSQKARVKKATAVRAAKMHLGKSWLGRTIHKVVLSDGRK